MTKISEYPVISTPELDDLLIGTDANNSDITKNFSLGSIIATIGDINQGPIGPQGSTGPTGPQGPVGPAGLEWQGAWDEDSSYAADDAVGYDGASYFCILAIDTTSNPAPDEDITHWALLASQGAVGPTGPAGPTGAQGPAGTALLTYKSYAALLSCTNSSTVTVTLLDSDLGVVTWTRNSAGNYSGSLPGEFTIGKTLILLTPNNGYYVGLTSTANFSTDTIFLEVFDTNTLSNIDYIENIGIEIRVYN
jgi:hypothetical protein